MTQFWVRVDERLIHGQVTVAWRRYLNYTALCIADDQTAADPFLSAVLAAATPDGVQTTICTVADAARAAPWANALILVKTPQAALKLRQSGLGFDQLDIGNIAAGPGKKRVYRSISLGHTDIAALSQLAAQGVQITFRQTPDDRAETWNAIKKRLP